VADTLRSTLRARPDIPDEDIDDIIGIAAELQAHDRAASEGATLAEVEAVARELDVDPQYVDDALEELNRRRAAAAATSQKAALQAQERKSKAGIGAVTALVAGLLLLGGLGVAVQAASQDLAAAAANVEHARSYLDGVLDRQAALVPQLVALSGGDPEPLRAAADQLRAADSLDARLDASRALDAELARTLASLPPPANETEGVQRLGVQHELTGVQNRLQVESQRYRDAEQDWAQAKRGALAGVALQLGLVEAPAP
jgi:hypothetical protein